MLQSQRASGHAEPPSVRRKSVRTVDRGINIAFVYMPIVLSRMAVRHLPGEGILVVHSGSIAVHVTGASLLSAQQRRLFTSPVTSVGCGRKI